MSTPAPNKKRVSRELQSLSYGPMADRDRNLRGRGARVRGLVTSSAQKISKNTIEVTPQVAAQPIASTPHNAGTDGDASTPAGNQERANLLSTAAGGDIAAELDDGSAVADEENNQVPPPYASPPPPKGNGKKSFEAIEPVNVLHPKEVLELTFKNVMVCPNPFCATKVPTDYNYNTKTLETRSAQCGFASEMEITCKCCNWTHLLCPLTAQEKGDSPNTTPSKKRKSQDRDSEKFYLYEINCAMVLCVQQLGKGFTHLAMILAHLGILNSVGSKYKWSNIADRVGLASSEVAEEAMEDNRKMELDLVEADADTKMLEWLQSEEGKDADEETTSAKRDELLKKKDGKVGIVMSGDEGWTTRRIGKNGGDSNTGQNFGVGGLSKRIISAQSSSKSCRICTLAKKLEREPKQHRCPRNFDPNKSSKSMEGYSNAQHLVDVYDSQHNIYVCGFVCDDDSSTRVNQKHSYKEIIMLEHPEAVEEDADGDPFISGANKRKYGWPTIDIPETWMPAGNGRYFKPKKDGGYHDKPTLPQLKDDHGLLPLHVPEPFENYADINHRCRVFGNRTYELRAPKATTKSNRGLDGGECENAKRNLGCFLAKNQHYSEERFCKEALCVVLHMWDYHHLCDIEWCTALQAEKEESPRKKRKIDNRKKYRSDKTESGMKLKLKTIERTHDLLVGPKMKEVHHGYNTQKNETLNKQQSQYCPKDQSYGGSMQFHDGVRLLVVMDSLGHYEGLQRLYYNLGLPPLNKAMGLWAATKDKEDEYKSDYQARVDIKRKRAAAKVQKMKDSMKKDMRAEEEGVTYNSGMASETCSGGSIKKKL